MKSNATDTSSKAEVLASDIRHIAEEIRPLTDSLDSLYILLQHVWQNREELADLLGSIAKRVELESKCSSLPAETVFCTCCEAVCSTSIAEALRGGWQCIIDDEGNDRGNYAGMCPACIEEEEQPADPAVHVDLGDDENGSQKTLF